MAHDVGGAVTLHSHLHGGVFLAAPILDIVAIPPSGSPFFDLAREHPHVLGRLPWVDAQVRLLLGDGGHLVAGSAGPAVGRAPRAAT